MKLAIYQKPSLVKKIGKAVLKFFLHLIFNKFTFVLLVIAADLAIIYNGWLLAVGATTQLIQKFQAEDNTEWNIEYKAKPLSELPVEMQIKKVFGKNAKVALAVAKAESGMKCTAVNTNKNRTSDLGLYQLNTVHKAKFAGKNMLDCTDNLLVAKQIYDRQGWTPWVSWKSGIYKRYL